MAFTDQAIPIGPNQRQTFPWGPPRAMHDRRASAGAQPDRAIELTNVWIKDADTVSPIVTGRPGFSLMGGQTGSVGQRVVQAFHQFTKVAGTERTVQVCGGELFTYDWGTNAWTQRISAAALAGASITLSVNAEVYAASFADNLVVSDGTNTAFGWDGTPGSGLTKMTNAPVFYGQPVIYYAKLFGIKQAERTTLVWSEEGALNTGYEASGYTNAWTIRQTSQEPIYALAATNSALYVFRQNSYTYITGEVTPELSAFGTREGGEKVGTRSPKGVLVIEDKVYVATSDRRVVEIQGTSVRDISSGAREMCATWSTTLSEKLELSLWDAGADGLRIMVGFPENAQSDMSAYLCLNPATGECEGVWRGFIASAIATVRNGDGERRWVHGGGSSATTLDEGYSYVHDVPTGTIFDDQFQVSTLPISHVVETPELGASPTTEIQWRMADLTFNAPTTMTGVITSVLTPRGSKTLGTNLTVPGVSGASLWDIALWDSGLWAAVGGERHITAGMQKVVGRWVTVKLTHAVVGERFGLSQIVVHGEALGHRPSAY